MAYPFRVILSPLDFDENSLAALDLARQLAVDHPATIHLLHVVPSVLAPEEASAAYSSREEEIGERLKQIARERFAGLDCQIHALVGDTAKTIVHAAHDLNADLIVIATHGRTGLQHLFLGSVADRVVRESPCPVLTIRPPAK
jgi:nucleotide-binding universal stress UspA family protein